MKPAARSAVASVLHNRALKKYFRHDGLRTVLCAYAMHAVTSRWLGYATLSDGTPMLVDEVATHSRDLDWSDINSYEDVYQTAEYLGKAMGKFDAGCVHSQTRFISLAKIHCLSDVDSIEKVKHSRHHTDLLPLEMIPKHTERAIRDAIGGDDDAFIQDMIAFAAVRRAHDETFRMHRVL